MPLNVGGINPAVLKAKNVATEQYVDTSVSSIDVSYSGLSGKDSLAQELGYANYSAMQAAAVGGSTVINGGYLNTSLIEAEGITADMVVSSGLITNSAQIGDALITNAKVGNAAITNAKIADAAIDNAKIGTAAVDTLQLAGQSVTIPSSAYTSSSTGFISGSWVDLQTVSYTSTGNNALITFSTRFELIAGQEDVETAKVRILVNGSSVYSNLEAEKAGPGTPGNTIFYRSFSSSILHTPPSGAVTVKLQALGDSGGGDLKAAHRTLSIIEVKR